MTYTAANWNFTQRVLLRAVDDDVVEGHHLVDLVWNVPGESLDPYYDEIVPNMIQLFVSDAVVRYEKFTPK